MKRSFLSDPGLSKAPAHCPDAVGKALDGSVIEVDIGKGGKKTIGQKGGAGISVTPASMAACEKGGSVLRRADPAKSAVDGCLPQTPVLMQPVFPAVC